MNKKNSDLLLERMREDAQILRETRAPSRRFTVDKKEDVQFVRQTFHASQDAFANFMGVSVSTLRNWEQGRRRPTGATRVLLTIALRQPVILPHGHRPTFRIDDLARRLFRRSLWGSWGCPCNAILH